MLTRREFLRQATVTLVLTPVVTAACSSSVDTGTTTTTSPTIPACDGVEEQSTFVENHSHNVCVPTTDLTAPPAKGMTYNTSTTSGHAHTITLGADDLATIEGGGTVTVATSNIVDPLTKILHQHLFTIAKATSIPAPTPTMPGY